MRVQAEKSVSSRPVSAGSALSMSGLAMVAGLLLVGLSAGLLAGCGQKGPLTLPKAAAQATAVGTSASAAAR